MLTLTFHPVGSGDDAAGPVAAPAVEPLLAFSRAIAFEQVHIEPGCPRLEDELLDNTGKARIELFPIPIRNRFLQQR